MKHLILILTLVPSISFATSLSNLQDELCASMTTTEAKDTLQKIWDQYNLKDDDLKPGCTESLSILPFLFDEFQKKEIAYKKEEFTTGDAGTDSYFADTVWVIAEIIDYMRWRCNDHNLIAQRTQFKKSLRQLMSEHQSRTIKGGGVYHASVVSTANLSAIIEVLLRIDSQFSKDFSAFVNKYN